jgi:hypothetical protein
MSRERKNAQEFRVVAQGVRGAKLPHSISHYVRVHLSK